MAKDMNLDSSQHFGLLCFAIYLYFPEIKQNLNQFNQIHKALLFFSETKNNAVSLCMFLSPEFLKSNIPNESRPELAECTPHLSRLATIPAVYKDIRDMTMYYFCSCYTCFPFLVLELLRMSTHV